MENFNLHLKTLISATVSVGLLLLVACAKENFVGQAQPCANPAVCVAGYGIQKYNYSVTAASQPVDVLFVVDNSASMYVIQQQIGSQFPSLFSILNNYDFHVAITTTDISSNVDPSQTPPNMPSAINQNGALQDGHLITFPNSKAFLDSSASNPQALFSQTIARSETLSCQQWIQNNCPISGCTNLSAYQANCPSEDTRGIFAAMQTLTTDNSGFLRGNAPLTVVIVSNSDERAAGGPGSGDGTNGSSFASAPPLLSNDLPSTLISQAQSMGKPLSVYSIVIQPGDSSCYQQQHINGSEFGWYGGSYASLASQTSGGVSSICSNNFSQNLSSIGAGIQTQMKNLTLYCVPTNGVVTLTYSGGQAQTVNATGTVLALPTPLQVGQSVQVSYSCTSTQ